MRIGNSELTKNIDNYCINKLKIPSIVLMENAAIKVVKNIDEAINIINEFGSGHSEAIVTRDYENSQKFLQKVNAAAVYVNASTRFTDGEEFGFGAEIGISTQKLHARGPMGLKELTTIKYIIYGNGQIR